MPPLSPVDETQPPQFDTPYQYRHGVELSLQLEQVPTHVQDNIMRAVDAYLEEGIVVTAAVLLQADSHCLDWTLDEARNRLLLKRQAPVEALVSRVCADRATRASATERYTQLQKAASQSTFPDSQPSVRTTPSLRTIHLIILLFLIIATATSLILLSHPSLGPSPFSSLTQQAPVYQDHAVPLADAPIMNHLLSQQRHAQP